jgi:thiamine monophosphate synthase
MYCFAITPDNLSPAELNSCLGLLKNRSVSHLYLRARSLHADLDRLVPLLLQHAFVPIIPRDIHHSRLPGGCGVHTRSDEHFEKSLHPSAAVQTASCHSVEDACSLLDKGADYVFISPVYRPFSKPEDKRPLIETDSLRMLSRRYGTRIVLLGGLTLERINNLRTMLDTGFSVAGISMFFTTGTTHEHDPNTDIH